MSWAERWRLYGLALREAGRSLRLGLGRVFRGPRWRAPRPERLLFAPQDLRTSDPTYAQEVYGGLFMLGGRTVDTRGGSPFGRTGLSSSQTEALYGFGWLRHLRAADSTLARESARALVTEAIGPRRRELDRGIPRRTDVAARRLVAFLCQSPLVLNGADHPFYEMFLRAIGRNVDALERDATAARRPLDRLLAATALSYAALCCAGLENRLKRSTRLLAAELDRQILPDGGHVSRHPGVLVELLLDLLPLRLMYASRNMETPRALSRAIDRMMPMLRYLRHPGGELALFNGMGPTAVDHIATLLSYDAARTERPAFAEPSGYLRLEAGGTSILADVGRAPPLGAAASAHAGCLAFELSSGRRRIVVNCGSPSWDGHTVAGSRRTAAHSTLQIAGSSSGSFLDDFDGGAPERLVDRFGPALVFGPGRVSAERGADGLVCTARHDGWASRFGVLHERRWILAPDGTRLDGEDRLIQGGRRRPETGEIALRFHLHPSVELAVEGPAVTLALPGGETWVFSTEHGGPVRVESSVFYGGAEGWRPTRQLVVPMSPSRDVATRWRFEKRRGPAAASPPPATDS